VMDCGAQALITGPVGSDVKITISKATTRLTKSAVLTRRGASNTNAGAAPAMMLPMMLPLPPACALAGSPVRPQMAQLDEEREVSGASTYAMPAMQREPSQDLVTDLSG